MFVYIGNEYKKPALLEETSPLPRTLFFSSEKSGAACDSHLVTQLLLLLLFVLILSIDRPYVAERYVD